MPLKLAVTEVTVGDTFAARTGGVCEGPLGDALSPQATANTEQGTPKSRHSRRLCMS